MLLHALFTLDTSHKTQGSVSLCLWCSARPESQLYSLPGATQLSQVRFESEVILSQRTGCSLSLFALYR